MLYSPVSRHFPPLRSYSLLDTGWTTGVRFLSGAGNFFLRHRIQRGFGAHPDSYRTGTGGPYPGVKRPGREADHSPPSSAEVKNAWSYTSTPPHVFMTWCLVKCTILHGVVLS